MDGELQHAFEDGRLIRPDWMRANLVDLVRALSTLAGVPDLPASPGMSEILRHIPPSDHLVFVLVDGMGLNLLRRLDEKSFLQRHLRMELLSVFPSTTAAALTSVATGCFPNRHAVPGWWTYLKDAGVSATMLPFVDRFTHRPLNEQGVAVEKAFPVAALQLRMKHDPLAILPAKLPNTPYSIYSRGGTKGSGYWAIDAAIDEVIARVRSAVRPTYTYLYISDVDTLSHFRGWSHEDVVALTGWIDGQLARLADALSERGRLVVASDHGQTIVPLAERLPIYHHDPLMELLLVPPTGNPPTPLFHVRPGRHEEFVAIFNDRFAKRYSLVSVEEAESMELFGPGKISDVARGRIGDFVGIPRGPFTLKYYERGKIPATDDYGGHSGLTPDEMRIPLAVA